MVILIVKYPLYGRVNTIVITCFSDPRHHFGVQLRKYLGYSHSVNIYRGPHLVKAVMGTLVAICEIIRSGLAKAFAER